MRREEEGKRETEARERGRKTEERKTSSLVWTDLMRMTQLSPPKLVNAQCSLVGGCESTPHQEEEGKRGRKGEEKERERKDDKEKEKERQA